jgi:hypothetical protein
MSGPSGIPFRATEGIDNELVKYLDRIGRPANAVADLPASPTNSEIGTAFNALLASLREAGKMTE